MFINLSKLIRKIKPKGYAVFHSFNVDPTCSGLNSHIQGSVKYIKKI
jgi:hypothetical protein